MRDPTVNAKVEAAIAMAYREFSYLKERGLFPKKAIPDPDGMLRNQAHDIVWSLPEETMPAHLRAFVCKTLLAPRTGRHTYASDRDLHIADAVYHVVTEHGFEPTRNEATRDKGVTESACSIVQKALERVGIHMDERVIEGIWSQASPEILPK